MAAPIPIKPEPKPEKPASRMTLANVTRGRREVPFRVLIHGVDGVGKSTFGAEAPEPIFLGPEQGTNHLDVARFPAAESWADVLDALREIARDPGPFKTLVIDSLDWIEPLIWQTVCAADNVKSIADVGGGYGKGYDAALDEWRRFLAALEYVQRTRGLHLVLIAHSLVKKFSNPEGEDYERYELKMNAKAAGICREWSEGVYFAQFETFAVKQKGKRVKGVASGARLLHTQRTAAYDAKDRYGLPESLPLSWEEFATLARAGQVANPADLKAEIARKAKELGGDLETKALAAMTKAGDDTTQLAKINNHCNAKLAERAERVEQPQA